MNKVGICGHFGEGRELLNGQTIKTKNVAAALEKELGKGRIYRVDTHGGIRGMLPLCAHCWRMFAKCADIIFLPAKHALLFLAPLFAVYNLFFHRRLHYIVIGGWLPQFLMEHGWLSAILRQMRGIYVETVKMKEALEEKGFKNVCLLENFRNQRPLQQQELVYTGTKPYPLCTFSRILLEKGIEDAIKAVRLAGEKLGEQAFILDIYGCVEPAYQARWKALKKDFPEYIRYVGPMRADNSVQTVKRYYAVLFPTYYPGEGFAGTLLDAMNAGVPVIASDWKYNHEIVIPGRTGILVPSQNPEKLCDALMKIAANPKEWNDMKLTCLEEAQRYAPEQAIKALVDRLA